MKRGRKHFRASSSFHFFPNTAWPANRDTARQIFLEEQGGDTAISPSGRHPPQSATEWASQKSPIVPLQLKSPFEWRHTHIKDSDDESALKAVTGDLQRVSQIGASECGARADTVAFPDGQLPEPIRCSLPGLPPD